MYSHASWRVYRPSDRHSHHRQSLPTSIRNRPAAACKPGQVIAPAAAGARHRPHNGLAWWWATCQQQPDSGTCSAAESPSNTDTTNQSINALTTHGTGHPRRRQLYNMTRQACQSLDLLSCSLHHRYCLSRDETDQWFRKTFILLRRTCTCHLEQSTYRSHLVWGSEHGFTDILRHSCLIAVSRPSDRYLTSAFCRHMWPSINVPIIIIIYLHFRNNHGRVQH